MYSVFLSICKIFICYQKIFKLFCRNAMANRISNYNNHKYGTSYNKRKMLMIEIQKYRNHTFITQIFHKIKIDLNCIPDQLGLKEFFAHDDFCDPESPQPETTEKSGKRGNGGKKVFIQLRQKTVRVSHIVLFAFPNLSLTVDQTFDQLVILVTLVTITHPPLSSPSF